METQNTSGQGESAVVPPEIADRWNWGAFLLTWIWGVANSTFIALLMFVPFVNLAMPFVLGAKGNAWAWRNQRWASVEEFQRVQRSWAKWGVVALIAMLALFAVIFSFTVGMLKDVEAYKLARAALERDAEVVSVLGQPLTTGTPMGNIHISGPNGRASLEFSVEGPNGQGTAYVEAVKSLGRWEIRRLAMDDEASGRRIDVVK